MTIKKEVYPGADEKTPSLAQYFSWINNTNEGATTEQTTANLEFFQYLHDEYGMILDIYAFDAGAIDGRRFYGKMDSERFRKQFPEGFEPLVKQAKGIGARLGLWGGPDGFGDTEESARKRINMMVSLCRDFHFELFKFDMVCGTFIPEHEKYFIEMMSKCRHYSPNLILLNHRIPLSEEGLRHATTFLWEGMETYIDILASNEENAPHHRARTMRRGLVPGLKRLCEDHGVCLSSCLDFWDDELILQAFNRSLILAPEIYGNPWLLRDNELPKLARIFNLHRKFRDILVDGIVLPEKTYGLHAVSRGNTTRRLVTLRNLSWDYRTFHIHLQDLGLELENNIEVRRFHPCEYYYGIFTQNDSVEITVPPYRSCLFYAGTPCDGEPYLKDVEFEVIRNVPGQPVEIDVLTLPEHRHNPIRKLGELHPCEIPENAGALYETTAFTSDSNCLEYRSLLRSGPTKIPQVEKARSAFFNQNVLRRRGVLDRNLFDGDPSTFFAPKIQQIASSVSDCCFRLDFGQKTEMDELVIRTDDAFGLWPLKEDEGNFAYFSNDLIHWETVTFLASVPEMRISVNGTFRYLKLPEFPQKLISVEGFLNGEKLDSIHWHVNHFFRNAPKFIKAWSGSFDLDEILPSSYLCIAIDGEHGVEGAFAAAEIDQQFLGCPDRAPSYAANHWEHRVAPCGAFYTYYLPLTEKMAGKTVNVHVLACDSEHTSFGVKVYMAVKPEVYRRKRIRL